MRLSLRPHPDTPGKAVTGIEVTLVQPTVDRLRLSYAVEGEMDGLSLPSPAAPLRTDGLWRTTCFEAFVRAEGELSYRELNFSPSSEWAAYLLRGYRDPNRVDAPLPAPPEVGLKLLKTRGLELCVDLHIELPRGPWRLGLSAVIEEKNGGLSYWALAHPPGDPDFHDPACFALELPAARPA